MSEFQSSKSLSLLRQKTLALLSHPGVVAVRVEGGKTMLHKLAESVALAGDVELLKAFCGHPEVASVRDDEGNTPLHDLALQEISNNSLAAILGHRGSRTSINKIGKTPLDLLVARGDPLAKAYLSGFSVSS